MAVTTLRAPIILVLIALLQSRLTLKRNSCDLIDIRNHKDIAYMVQLEAMNSTRKGRYGTVLGRWPWPKCNRKYIAQQKFIMIMLMLCGDVNMNLVMNLVLEN